MSYQGGTSLNPYDDQGVYEAEEEEPEAPPEPAFPSTVPAGPSPAPVRSLHSLGMSDDLWRQHRQWQLESIRQLDPADPRHKAVPSPYCNAWPLDYEQAPRSSFGYPCATFQVVSREDGHLYCLRRFDSIKSVSQKIAASVSDQWVGFEHPNLVSLHTAFVAQRAVFFVHQYIPGVVRLRDRLMGSPVTEAVLWSAICQWTSVIRRVHQSRMAVRTLDARHVLLQMDALRVRWFVNCAGVPDALEWESRKPLEALQLDDIRQLGRLILSLATGREITASTDSSTIANCERFCMQNYSRELHNLTMTLIRSQTPPSILDVCRALAGRVWDEWEHTSLSLNRTERALGAEFESGRMLRLMLKLGFVNERPEFGPNRRWAQSGDCYILTLFRDYGEFTYCSHPMSGVVQ
jgi:PAB-dependent poly(A)-specific ribonuclease subunit 3